MRPYNLVFSTILTTCLLTACSSSNRDQLQVPVTYSNKAPIPQVLSDPYERINRGVWAANASLLKGVVHPSARVYRSAVPQSVRGSIKNFGQNVTYPKRLVNKLLQGKWTGAKDETTRFLSNTTVGIGGLFDPATKWGIAKSNTGFGQTFSKWGWRPKNFIVLPLFGPSDDLNAVGLIADRAANPLNYTKQPYRSAPYLTTYNQLANTSEGAQQLIEVEADSYSIVKSAWTYISKYDAPVPDSKGEIDLPTLQTLAAAAIAPKNKEFIASSKEVKVKIPTTGKKLKFNYWLQPHSAPLVYIVPGLYAHRLSNLPLALAEHLYEQGYSVVSTTSVFHPEFMENASTSDLPIYAPADSKDLIFALTQMDNLLVKKHPKHFSKRAIVGMSMGGFISLNLAIREEQSDQSLVKFDRYVAINTPVDMIYSANLIDRYINSPEAWPENERQACINNTIHKATASGFISRNNATPMIFGRVESEYLVGLTFRFGLRDLIYSSQLRNDHGVLQNPLSKWKREPVYNEIMQYSYHDYFYKLAVPYYEKKGISKKELLRHACLKCYEQELKNQPKIRIITNSNDFMLPSNDLKWLKKTFSHSQLSVFPQGGHLGNLNSPEVQQAVLKALKGLK